MMKTKLVPGWLRTFSNMVIFLPMLGLFTQFLGSEYLKQYTADVLITIINTVGSALIDIIIQAIFGIA